MNCKLLQGDCREVMKTLPAESMDSIVCDPPYGLSFMGKEWDHGVPGVEFWREALRVAKPGAMLLAFGGTRTFHRLAVAIEDAGWEMRDTLMWVYGSGFPKSLDVSKAIDRAAGAEREDLGPSPYYCEGRKDQRPTSAFDNAGPGMMGNKGPVTAPATDAARQWQGWGTALKPAWEPIIMARKPIEGTVAANVLKWGTGAINVDGCRVAINPDIDDSRLGGKGTWATDKMAKNVFKGSFAGVRVGSSPQGRWPANLIHDGSQMVLDLFPSSNGRGPARTLKRSAKPEQQGWGMNTLASDEVDLQDAGKGSAARFFYCAKASKADRDEGCEGLPTHDVYTEANPQPDRDHREQRQRSNHHPTVKPTALMRYLCRLVTPPNGTILDPFMGSGSTGKAAVQEGFNFIGIEIDKDYIEIAKHRIPQMGMAL